MNCWSLKYMQIIRRLLILLLSLLLLILLLKGTFVHVSRYNFFVISGSRSKSKISVIQVSHCKTRKFTFTSKSSFTFNYVKKRLIHVHDMKKRPIHAHVIHVHDMKKDKFTFQVIPCRGVINIRNQFLSRFNVSLQCGKKL